MISVTPPPLGWTRQSLVEGPGSKDDLSVTMTQCIKTLPQATCFPGDVSGVRALGRPHRYPAKNSPFSCSFSEKKLALRCLPSVWEILDPPLHTCCIPFRILLVDPETYLQMLEIFQSNFQIVTMCFECNIIPIFFIKLKKSIFSFI